MKQAISAVSILSLSTLALTSLTVLGCKTGHEDNPFVSSDGSSKEAPEMKPVEKPVETPAEKSAEESIPGERLRENTSAKNTPLTRVNNDAAHRTAVETDREIEALDAVEEPNAFE